VLEHIVSPENHKDLVTQLKEMLQLIPLILKDKKYQELEHIPLIFNKQNKDLNLLKSVQVQDLDLDLKMVFQDQVYMMLNL